MFKCFYQACSAAYPTPYTNISPNKWHKRHFVGFLNGILEFVIWLDNNSEIQNLCPLVVS